MTGPRWPLAVALAVTVAGCTPTQPPRLTAPFTPTPAAPARTLTCAWYTPTVTGGTPDGQQVIVTDTGPACHSLTLIAWIARTTGKPWASTRLVAGYPIARITRDSDTVTIYQAGFDAATTRTAGYLAVAFQTAGWTPRQLPPHPAPPLPTHPDTGQ